MITERKKRHVFICSRLDLLLSYAEISIAEINTADVFFLKTRFVICWCFYFLQRRLIMTMEEPEDTYYLIIWSQLGSYFSFFLKFANYMFSKQIYIMRFLYCVIFSLSYSFNLPWVQTVSMMVFWRWQRKY